MPVSADQRAKELYEFGPFRVDPEKEILLRGGEPVPLTPKSFQILLVLVRHNKEVVTKDDLMKMIWPDTFVEEANLSRNIFLLRKALGESPQDHQYIVTVPGRGYRFIASVEGVNGGPDAIQQKTTKSALRRWGLPLVAAAILLAGVAFSIIAALAASNWAPISRWRTGASARPIESLAVLPLENLSRDPEQEYFSDGMTDALTSQLFKMGALRVTSLTSAMRYKGTKKSLPEIGRELNVDGLIEGSVMRSGNRVRIVVHLIQAQTDQHVWTETYERDLADILRLQSDVSQAVAQQVRAQLTPAQQARLRNAPAVDPQAYDAYLKGRGYEPANTQAAIKHAQAYYEEAIRRDPKFAPAYVGLAICYLDLGLQRWLPPQEAYRLGSEAVQKALQLDDSLAQAHSKLGYLEWRYGWDWQRAEKELRRAIELNSDCFCSREMLVWYSAWSGRHSEALAELEEMRRIDPAYPFSFVDEAGIYYHQRNYKSLVRAAQKSVAADPNGWIGHYLLAVGYEGSGQPAQAVAEYQQAVDLSQRDSDTVAGLAHAYAAVGRKADAEKLLSELRQRSKDSYSSPYMIATIYLTLGQKDKALEFLEKAFQERSPDLAYFLKADLRMDPLRSDPRFQSVLRRVGLL